jgi:lambda repressor-like predicted transcriptional regulator
MICPPDHPHAKNSGCYTGHKCRCAPCTEGRRITQMRRRKAKAYGRPTTRLIPVAPTREHIWDLLNAGMSAKRIATLAGTGYGPIMNILNRPNTERVRADIAAAILAVPADPDLSAHRDPRGTHRRIQALVAQGWSLARLGEYLGTAPTVVRRTLERAWVTQDTHERVAAVFAELWDKEPPRDGRGNAISYSRSRAYAARKGWVGPLAWDDIDHDEAPAEAA